MFPMRYFSVSGDIPGEKLFKIPQRRWAPLTDESFTSAVRTYGDTVYRVAYHALKNRADAEDVMQTTLLRLLEHRQPFESEEHMKHWLLRVAVNESRKLLRSFWRRHAVPLDEWRDAPVFQDPAQSELFQAVMALDAKYRLTIYLYYYEGCSVSETAAALRAKPSTVQTWLQRARARLRRTLSEEEEGEGPEHVRPQIVP